jgi:hypothetical protein
MAIKIAGKLFDGPFDNTRFLKNQSGVYAILDNNYNVVDAGESQDVKKRIENHDRKSCWSRHNGTNVAVYYISGSLARLTLESLVRQTYNPPCGKI